MIWLAAGIFYLFEFTHRVAVSVMIPELMQSFDVSIAAVANLSACYFYAYAIAQIPVGLILDRFNVRTVLTLSCIVLTISSIIFSITDAFVIAELCRVFIGLGSAFAFVGCLKLGSEWFEQKHFGLIIGLTNLLGIAGAIIGGKPTAIAVDAFGWRNVMLMSGFIGLLVTILLWKVINENIIVPNNNNNLIKNIISKLRVVIINKQIWITALFGGLLVAPIGTYSELWGVSFLMDHYQLDRPAAAEIATLSFVGIAVGGPTIGWISDKLQQRKLPMLFGCIGAALCMSSVILCNTMPLWLNACLHFTFGFCTSSMLLIFSIATSACTPATRATTIAFVNSIIMVMLALLQSLSGYLLDYFEADFNIGFTPIILCYIMAFICYYFIQEHQNKHDYF